MDTIADMLSGITNAGKAGKTTVVLPLSTLKKNIADALVAAGYLKAAATTKDAKHEMLELVLLYTKGEHRIGGVKRISKPSKRVYIGSRDIRPVKFGSGSMFLSTPKGILTDKEARKEMVGGEVLFEIW